MTDDISKTLGGRLSRSAGALIAVSALTKPVSFLREATVAALFGTSGLRDAFLVAWTIPNLASLLVTEGLSQVLISIMMGYVGTGRRREAWRMVSTLLNLLALAMIALSLLMMVAAPLFVAFLAPSFTAEAQALAVGLARLMAFCILFMGIANLLTGVLNVQQRFVWPALAPLILSLVTIAVMLLGWRRLGIYSLALGTLLGTLGMVLWQVPAALRAGASYLPVLDLEQDGVRQFGRLAGPLLLGTIIMYAPGIIDRMVASGLAEGSLSALDYAGRIMQLVFSLFIPSLITPLFPSLSLYAADGDRARFRHGLVTGIKAVEAIALPVAAGLMALSQPIVRLLYQRGEFDVASTALTASALALYAPGFALAAWWVLFQAFFAQQDMRSRVQIALVMAVTNGALDVLFGRLLGAQGLALASSAGAAAALVSGAWLLQRKSGEALWRDRALLIFLAKVVLAAMLAGLAGRALYGLAEQAAAPTGFVAQALVLAVAGGAAALIYAGALWLLRVRELGLLLRQARRDRHE